MKIFSLICLFTIFFWFAAISQKKDSTSKEYTVVYLKDYCKEKGVIFSKNYDVRIKIEDFNSRYTPTLDDVTKAEEIFSKQYNDLEKVSVDTKIFFYHWVRQNIGLIDIRGNRNIVVQLIYNNKPGKINRMLGKGWESVFIVSLWDEFYAVHNIFRVNINTNNMTTSL